MRTKMRMRSALMVVAAFACMILAGCAIGVAGARVSLATPLSKPNFSYDSVGVAQKNDRAAGARFPGGAGGTAAKGDADTLTGTADQIVQVGGDASNQRSTDAAGATGQGQASKAGQVGGDMAPVAKPTQEHSLAIPVAVAPGGIAKPSASAPAGSPGTNAGEGVQPAAAPSPSPAPNYDHVANGIAKNADGTVTATWPGGSVTGTAIGGFQPTDGAAGMVYIVTPAGGSPVRLLLTAEQAAAMQ